MRQRHPLPVKLTHEVSGALVQEGTNCADTMDGTAGNEIGLYACHGQGRNQVTFISHIYQQRDYSKSK